jgi:hypothetical protein
VRLTPIGYEFSTTPSRWETDWIVIQGDIVAPEGSWTFQHGALVVRKCHLLLEPWLRDALHAEVSVSGPGEKPTLTFLDPCLGFSVASYGKQTLKLRVHLRHQAAPPWHDRDDDLDAWAFFVELVIGVSDLERAAQEWNRESGAFPSRSLR